MRRIRYAVMRWSAPDRSTLPGAALTLILIGAGSLLPLATADDDPFAPGTAQETAPARRSGAIIDAPANPVNFAPESDAVVVDAESVDLPQVYEDLGPIARLWYQHVQSLANPFFEGRVPGSRGMELTNEYLEFYFAKYGLEPAFPDPSTASEKAAGARREETWTSYRQPFTFNYAGSRMRARVTESTFEFDGRTLDENEDYTVLGVSGTGELTAPLAFVGYGIDEGPDGYTSFEQDTDLTGRIAVLLRYEPLNEEGGSQWAERRFSRQAGMSRKLRAVRDHGAAGILLVNPPGALEGATGLESVTRSSQFGPPLPIVAMHITPEVADQLLQAADPVGRSIEGWRELADEGEVRTVMLDPDVTVTIGADVSRGGAQVGVDAENIGAVLRGRGDLADEWIIIGAHHDHVGMGEFGSAPQNRGQLHPGADDNASGTAGLLILAKTLSEHYADAPGDADLRSILIIGFSAEESGLHGSRAYARNPSVPADRISAMLNMDMIGRVRGGNITVMGVATAEGLEEILRPHFESSGLTVAVSPGTSGRSDDANFININVPAMHFFSGLHDDYHTPADQAHTVNPAGARDILRLVHHITLDLASRPERLVFTTPRPRDRNEGAAESDRGYAPVRLGIRPGMGAEIEAGVLIEGVTPGTSAADAGLQAGDVILGWNDYNIGNIRDLFEQLQKHKPGDVVMLTVQRGEEEVRIEVILKASTSD